MNSEPAIDRQSAPSAKPSWIAIAATLAAAALVIAHAVLQFSHFTPGCPETDTDAYLTLAERFAGGSPIGVIDNDPLVFNAHCWLENSRGELVPKYSPGQSLLMAIGLELGGPSAAYAVNPLLGALALVGAFLLFRRWMSPFAALWALLALASNPMYQFLTVYPLAHAADVFFVTWGMLFLWLWLDSPRVTWGLAAGLFLGYSILVRPQDIMLAPTVGAACVIAMMDGRRKHRQPWPGLVALLAAYAALLAAHGAYNAFVFGSPWLTGYGLSHEQSAFSFSNGIRNLPYAATVLGGIGLSAYFWLGLVGIPLANRPRDAVLKLLWVVPLFLLLCAYYWAPRVNPQGYGRFFLALFPVFIGSAYSLLDRVPSPAWLRHTIMALLCLLVFGYRFPEMRRPPARNPAMQTQHLAAETATRHLEKGTVLFAERPAAFHFDTRQGFRVYDLHAFDSGFMQSTFGANSDSDVMWQPSRKARLMEFYDRNAKRLDIVLKERAMEFARAGRPVVFILAEHSLPHYRALLAPDLELAPAVTWSAPVGGQWAIYRCEPVTAQPAAPSRMTSSSPDDTEVVPP